jgi:hypothetical protein
MTLVGEHRGYGMYFAGCSYSCPELKLYGYRNDLQLKRAISRTLNDKVRVRYRAILATITKEAETK